MFLHLVMVKLQGTISSEISVHSLLIQPSQPVAFNLVAHKMKAASWSRWIHIWDEKDMNGIPRSY